MNNGITIWNGYPVHGDIKELDRIIESGLDLFLTAYRRLMTTRTFWAACYRSGNQLVIHLPYQPYKAGR